MKDDYIHFFCNHFLYYSEKIMNILFVRIATQHENTPTQ